MKKFMLGLWLCLIITCVSLADTQERVINLPNDSSTWYLTIFGEVDDEKFIELQSWLTSNAGLAKLKAQVRFNKYTTDQVRYERYMKDMPGLPCIRLQNEKGLVVSEFWSDNIPKFSSILYRGIREDLQDKTSWGCIRRRRCPQPQPQPKPEPPPPPPVEPVEPPIGPPVLDEPESEPEPEPKESRLWMLLVLLSGFGGGAFGFVQEYKAEHLDKPGSKSSKL